MPTPITLVPAINRPWKLRVNDLDAIFAQLRAAGAIVDSRIEDSEYGKFG